MSPSTLSRLQLGLPPSNTLYQGVPALAQDSQRVNCHLLSVCTFGLEMSLNFLLGILAFFFKSPIFLGVRVFMAKKKKKNGINSTHLCGGGNGRRSIANKKAEKCHSVTSPPYAAVSISLSHMLNLNHSPIFAN